MKWLFPSLLLLVPSLARAADFGVNAANYDGGAWSPYLVGAGIGVLSWLIFYFADKAIGASSFYATLAGFIGKLVARKHTESLKYYQSNPPVVDYGFVFVICTIIGGFTSGQRARSHRSWSVDQRARHSDCRQRRGAS